jgi:hypothetical protein
VLYFEVIASFKTGIVVAKNSGEVAADEVYDAALNWVVAEFGVKKVYVDQAVADHYAPIGYPSAW